MSNLLMQIATVKFCRMNGTPSATNFHPHHENDVTNCLKTSNNLYHFRRFRKIAKSDY